MALGAYAAETGRGNLLNALAHPSVVNPAAALQQGWQAAGTLYNLREAQAQQAWGQALQQATNPQTGEVDWPTAQRLAAANPMAAMGMAKNLQNASNIRSQQVEQNNAMVANVARSGTSIMYDPSDANLEAQRQEMLRLYPGNATFINSEFDAAKKLDKPGRVTWAYNHVNGQLDSRAQMAASPFGQTTNVDIGGATVPGTLTQRTPWTPGSLTVGQGGAAYTLSPGQAVTQVTFPADQAYVQKHPGTTLGQQINRPLGDVLTEQGAGWALPPGARVYQGGGGGGGPVNRDGTPVSQNPPRLLKVPGGDSSDGGTTTAPNGPPAPPGSASSGPYTGGGIGTVLNPPGGNAGVRTGSQPYSVAPPPVVSTSPTLRGPGTPVPPAQTPGPSVNSPTDSMTPQPRAAIAPSAQFAGPGAPTDVFLGSTAASPAAQADANVIQAAMRARAAAGTTPGVQTAGDVALGPGTQEIEENKQSGAMLAQHDTATANYPQTIFPYTQALHLYGRGMTTAPGADLLNTAKGWANGVARSVGVTGPFDSTQEYDALHKYLTQITSSNPVAAGSDARLAAVLAGNANTGIHELAGADMIKAGIALQRMTVALNSGWHALTPQQQSQYGGSYLNYLRAQAPNIDVRAFARDLYNPEQLKTLNETLQNGSQTDRQHFLDTLKLGRDAGIIGSGVTKAMP